MGEILTSRAPSSPGTKHPTQGIRTPMVRIEADRTHQFTRFAFVLFLGGFLALPFFEGPAILEAVYACALGASVAVNTWTFRVTRHPEQTPASALSSPWLLHVITITATIIYFGVLSPAPILSVLVVSFAGSTMPRPRAIRLYLGATIPQLAVGLAIAGGQLEDPGIITGAHLPGSLHLLAHALIQMVHLIMFNVARAAHPERTLQSFDINLSE